MQNFGHGALDFSATAVKNCVGRRLEYKVCEGFCRGTRFLREVPKTAKHGAKVCAECAARIRAEQRSDSRPRVWVPPTPQQHWNKEMSRMVM